VGEKHKSRKMAAGDVLFTIAVLIDELKHEEVPRRLESMNRLKEIADALGPDRTRNELLPFLAESLDDDDEVLLVMADQFGSFVKQVGGPNHAASLLSPLESLATVEESVVRDRAVQSMISVSKEMSDSSIQENFLSLLKSLAQKDWFTSRIAACALFAATYPRVSAGSKSELRGMFGDLCRDDTPMVRRAAASNMGDFVSVAESEYVKSELIPLFASLSEDEQDSVRLLVVPIGIAIAKSVSADVAKQAVVPVCLTLAQDKAWRVRWSVANSFSALMEALKAGSDPKMIEAFLSLLKDNEAEVRGAAAQNLAKVAKLCPPSSVLPTFGRVIEDLASDANEHVREALASVIMALAPVVGKDQTMQQLLSSFIQLLRDENPQVRLAIVAQIGTADGVITIDAISTALLPAIIDLANDKNWRVRAQIITHIPILAKQMQVVYFEQNLLDLCLKWLSDRVFSIREAATKNLTSLTDVYGKEWTKSKIVPRIIDLKNNAHYLYRLTAVRAAEVLIPSLDKDASFGTLLPLILSLASDNVPNVRFGVAKALERLKIEDPTGSARACLSALAKDKDGDVVFFAKRALRVVPS
jgi:serine/threonine-protein phosphatase 2A regulatory subunit A